MYDITDMFWDIKEGVWEAVEWAKELATDSMAKQNLKNTEAVRDMGMESAKESIDAKNMALEKIKEYEAKDTISGNLKDAGKQIMEKWKDVAWDIKDKAVEIGTEIKDTVTETADKVVDKVVDTKEFLNDYLKEKLWSYEAVTEYLEDLSEDDSNMLQKVLKLSIPTWAAATMLWKIKDKVAKD